MGSVGELLRAGRPRRQDSRIERPRRDYVPVAHSTLSTAALAIMLLAGCASTPVVTAVDTICVSTSRPVITEAQRAAFRADQATWETLVDWLAGFLKVRDGACLESVSGA